jgi:hypothetical protein
MTRFTKEAPVPTYEIRVIGSLDPAAAAAFADLAVEVGPAFTLLSGDLDRPGLREVLDRMRAMGLELAEIRREPPAVRPSGLAGTPSASRVIPV